MARSVEDESRSKVHSLLGKSQALSSLGLDPFENAIRNKRVQADTEEGTKSFTSRGKYTSAWTGEPKELFKCASSSSPLHRCRPQTPPSSCTARWGGNWRGGGAAMAHLFKTRCKSHRLVSKPVAFEQIVQGSSAVAINITSVCFSYRDWMEVGLSLQGLVGGPVS